MSGIVWLASYPKSGNTWLRVFLANLLSEGRKPVDINELPTTSFYSRSVFDNAAGWESSDLTIEECLRIRLAVQESMGKAPGPTFLKVHEAFRHPENHAELFSKRATRAAIYIVRNPLDVAVSFSHHRGKSVDSTVKFMNSGEASLAGRSDRLDTQLPQPLGDWSGHVGSWVDSSDVPVHVMRYEDMRQDSLVAFAAACRFLCLPHDPESVRRALEFSSFEELQKQERQHGFREAIPGREFFRKGRDGCETRK